MSAVVIALVLIAVMVALACYVGYQLLLQHGRLLLRLEALEHRLEASGIAPAPGEPTVLPDLNLGGNTDLGRQLYVAEHLRAKDVTLKGEVQRVRDGNHRRKGEQANPVTCLKVRGPFKGPGGYDHHVREFVRQLHRQGVTVELRDIPEWSPAKLPAFMRDPWFDSLDKPSNARVVLHFCMPHQIVAETSRVNINYTMFEATRICPAWVAVAHNRPSDLIVLPTESSQQAWIASGVPAEQIRLCPLGINTTLFSAPITPLPLARESGEPLSTYKVRFLNVSELGPRKNLLGLLRAWLRATSRHDDALLIIKLSCSSPQRLARFRSQLDLLQEQLRKAWHDVAPVHFIYDLFPDAAMPRVYAAATHYISMSFGEGWDQAMVEAAAAGLKLIAPNHSAYTAYLDPSCAHLITSREIPAVSKDFADDLGMLFENANWWEPDEEEAMTFIRSAIEGSDGGKLPPRDRILRDFTWENASRRLISIIGEAQAQRKWRGPWPRPRVYRRA